MLIELMERGMRRLYHQGAQTSFAPDAGDSLARLGEGAVGLYKEVVSRVKQTIIAGFNLTDLYSAGTLFTRIWADDLVPADGMDVDPGHHYWNPHVDKANRASYDYSALLYLNSHCETTDEAARRAASGEGSVCDALEPPHGIGTCDYASTVQPHFGGGVFAWLDAEEDAVVSCGGSAECSAFGAAGNGALRRRRWLGPVREIELGAREVRPLSALRERERGAAAP